MFVLFNKNTKEFIGYSEKTIPEDFLKTVLFKEISDDKTDFSKWAWSGNYDDGKMISLVPQEDETDDMFLFQKIYNEYPLDLQVVLIIDQLRHVADKLNCTSDEFKKMSNLILKAVEKTKN